MSAPSSCVRAGYDDGNTFSDEGCGCPENQKGWITRWSENGPNDLKDYDLVATCGNSRPCWSGYGSYSNGRKCWCFVNDYSQAGINISPGDYPEQAHAKASNRLDCCRGETKGGEFCAPGWCPRSISEDCDPVLETYCQDKPYDESCRTYCSIERNGVPRNKTVNNWCYDWTEKICMSGDSIATDNYCRKTISGPGHPVWADLRVEQFCSNNNSNQRYKSFCSCVNSPYPEASCTDSACTNTNAFMTTNQIEQSKNCGVICLTIFENNRAGEQFNFDGNIIQQTCSKEGINDELITWYSCSENGQCIYTPIGETGTYSNDPNCGGDCAPVEKQINPGYSPLLVVGIAIALLLIVLVILLFFRL